MKDRDHYPLKRNLQILKLADLEAYDEESATPIGSTPSMYQYYDSPISEFNYRFAESIKPHTSIEDLVDSIFPDNKELIGMELGGQGSLLFTNGFRKGRFQKTTGVEFKDLRGEFSKRRDEANNHHVIEGNILTRSKRVFNRKQGKETYVDRMPSWNTVRDYVEQVGKPDVLIQNILGPITIIKNPYLLTRLIERWLTISAQKSVNLFWIPNSLKEEEYSIVQDYFESMGRKHPTWTVTYNLDIHSDQKSVCIIKQ